MKNEKTFQFSLVLSGVDENTPNFEDALYEAGCHDALLNSVGGTVYLDFDRSASNFEEAVLSAIQQIEGAGIHAMVIGVEPAYLVNLSEIARRAALTRQYVSLLVKGERGDNTFPKPIMRLEDKSPLWRWKEVAQWLYDHKHLKDETAVNEARFIDNFNLILEFRQDSEENHHRVQLLKTLSKTHRVINSLSS